MKSIFRARCIQVDSKCLSRVRIEQNVMLIRKFQIALKICFQISKSVLALDPLGVDLECTWSRLKYSTLIISTNSIRMFTF